ncbi:MAG: hypothetical protein QXR60_04550 [Candidatus Nanoarchaeia archaeon]
MSEKVEKLYNTLRAKYKQLPDFKKLDSDFELTSIEDKHINERYFLRAVRRRIYEKVYYFNGALVTVIAPQSPNILLAHENKFISNDERDEVMEVVRKLTRVERDHLLLEVDYDEAEDADFIKISFDVWQDVKPTIKKLFITMRDSWDKRDNLKVGDYFG